MAINRREKAKQARRERALFAGLVAPAEPVPAGTTARTGAGQTSSAPATPPEPEVLTATLTAPPPTGTDATGTTGTTDSTDSTDSTDTREAPRELPEAGGASGGGDGGDGGGGGDTDAHEAELKAKAAEVAAAARAANDAWLRVVGRYVLGALTAAAVGGVLAAFATAHPHGWPLPWDLDPARGALVTTIVLIWGLLAIGSWVLRADGGLRALLIGKDGRFSTSQTQAALWTLGIGFVVAYLLLRKPFGVDGEFVKGFKQLDDVYLLMLGLPYAALVAARGITAGKVDNDQLQKVESSEAKIRDLVSNDDGNPALVDAQFLLFSMVALVYFVAEFAAEPTGLPLLPAGLVGLTGVSALAYTGNKAVTSNAPAISAVTRSVGSGPIRPGTPIDVRGANFVPEGAKTEEQLANVRVRFGDREVPVIPLRKGAAYVNPGAKLVKVVVPADVPAGTCNVVVVTAADVESDAYPITVVVDQPVVTGVTPSVLEVGKPVTLHGRFFRAPDATGRATVRFGDVPVLAETAAHHVRAVVPASAPKGGSTVVTVVAAGGGAESAPLTLHVAP